MVLLYLCSFAQNTRALTLHQWLEKIEKSSSFIFNYDPQSLSNEKITIPSTYLSHADILKHIQETTKYRFNQIDNKYIVVTTGRTGPLHNEVEISGYVVDELSNEPLIFANIYSEDGKCGCTTDENGHFKVKCAVDVHQMLVVSYLGYQEHRSSLYDYIRSASKKIKLVLLEQNIQDIIIKDEKNTSVAQHIIQGHVLKPAKMAVFPGQAEKDPLYLAQMLPGVTSIGESASNISIRGSTSDQNLVTWNQIPLYHTGHFVGLLASCNPFTIDEVEVLNDGFKSSYGGRIAGIIDMKSKQLHADKVSGAVNLNLLSANVFVQAPIIPKILSVETSFRTSFGNVFDNVIYRNFFNQSFQLGRITDIDNFIRNNNIQGQVFNHSEVHFKDYSVRFLMTPWKNDKIEFNFIQSADMVQNRLTLDWNNKIESDTIALQNTGWSTSWQHNFSAKWTTKLYYIQSDFSNYYSYIDDLTKQNSLRLVNKNNGVHETKFGFDNVLTLGDNVIEFGYQATNIRNLSKRFSDPVNKYDENEDITLYGKLDAGYLNYQYNQASTFQINLGLRYSIYNLSNQSFTEPRMTMWQEILPGLKLKASAGLYTQVLTQIEEYNDIQVEDMFWRLSEGKKGSELIPITSNSQYSGGLNYQKNQWQAELMFFSKNVENITALGLEFDNGLHPWWIANGQGQGIEAMVSKKIGSYNAMLSYTYNDMTLNFGNERIYPAPYNHRHNMSLVNGISLDRFQMSLLLNVRSGRPYSVYDRFTTYINDLGDPAGEFVYNEQFNFSLPTYVRLDLSLSYVLWRNADKNRSMVLGCSILNLLNQDNILSRTNYISYAEWPEIKPAIFDRRGLGFTPNIYLTANF